MSRRCVAVSATRGSVAADLALLDLVLRGEPVPHRNIERDAGRVAKVAHAVGTVDGELRRIDAVGVVQAQRRQIGGARGEHVGTALRSEWRARSAIRDCFLPAACSTSAREGSGGISRQRPG